MNNRITKYKNQLLIIINTVILLEMMSKDNFQYNITEHSNVEICVTHN